MYNDNNGNAVTGDELAGFLEQINPRDGKYPVSGESTKVEWRNLPFYEPLALIRLNDPNWINNNLNISYLPDHGNLFRLNSPPPTIPEVNAKAQVKVNASHVLEYLRFFSFFVRGEEG